MTCLAHHKRCHKPDNRVQGLPGHLRIQTELRNQQRGTNTHEQRQELLALERRLVARRRRQNGGDLRALEDSFDCDRFRLGGTTRLDRIVTMMEPQRHRLILDVGCGPGNFTRRIASCSDDIQVVGLDLSRQMLERAVELTDEQEFTNVRFMRGNAFDLPFNSESFDAVSCCGALEFFDDYVQVLTEISRVLRITGEFVCQTTVGPNEPFLRLRMAEQAINIGYPHLKDFKQRLSDLRLEVGEEEISKLSYIFKATKRI